MGKQTLGRAWRMARMGAKATDELPWVPAESGYSLALDELTLVARNPKGARLRSVPADLRKGETAEQLLALRDWLKQHETECPAPDESRMLRSQPVARSAITAFWDDPSWRSDLLDIVVTGTDPKGTATSGLLRDAGDDGLGIVDLDGETRRITSEAIVIPHPVRIDALEDYREFLGELSAEQAVPQLYREVFVRPSDIDPDATSVDTWAGARFKELRHALSRCATLGFRVSGGFATIRVWEDGTPVEARYWVGSDSPEAEAETGALVFTDAQSRSMRLGDVGRVAWSEGSRMAQLISAGRVQDTAEEPA
jgi:hypothetical protein